MELFWGVGGYMGEAGGSGGETESQMSSRAQRKRKQSSIIENSRPGKGVNPNWVFAPRRSVVSYKISITIISLIVAFEDSWLDYFRFCSVVRLIDFIIFSIVLCVNVK